MIYKGLFDCAEADRFMRTIVKLGFLHYARVDLDYQVSFASEDAHMLPSYTVKDTPVYVEMCSNDGIWEVYR